MAKIVEQFVDDSHWKNFFARGLSSHADGDYPNAVAMYSKARQSIQNDPNVRDEPSWRQRVTEIETLEGLARSANPLRLCTTRLTMQEANRRIPRLPVIL